MRNWNLGFQKDLLKNLGVDPNVALEPVDIDNVGKERISSRLRDVGIVTVGEAFEYYVREGEYPNGFTRKSWRAMLATLRNRSPA